MTTSTVLHPEANAGDAPESSNGQSKGASSNVETKRQEPKGKEKSSKAKEKSPKAKEETSEAKEEASDAKASNDIAIDLWAPNPQLNLPGVVAYFSKRAPSDWSLNDYKTETDYTDADDRKKITLFKSYITSLALLHSKCSTAAEPITSLLKEVAEPDPCVSNRANTALPLAGSPPSSAAVGPHVKLEGADYLQAFNHSVAKLMDKTHADEDIALSRLFDRQCTVETWPGVDELLNKVFGKSLEHSWEKSLAIVRGLPMDMALPRYLSVIFENYERYFKHHEDIANNMNEREGWGNITWPIISGALDVLDIKTRSFEVRVEGNQITRHFEEKGAKNRIMADGIGLSGSTQLYVAEASKLSDAELGKKDKDFQKLLRAMGDLAINHIETSKATSPPSKAPAVFGSYSFRNRTRFYVMDVTNNIPLRQLDMMIIVPLTQQDFTTMMPNCLRVALRFAWTVLQEIRMRESLGTAETPLDPADNTHALDESLSSMSISGTSAKNMNPPQKTLRDEDIEE
ncbi:hypothetical protein EC968_007174 [Mortierella alpina]|nr:hypothetical protein EC968_007174 [Mortierella alpina]